MVGKPIMKQQRVFEPSFKGNALCIVTQIGNDYPQLVDFGSQRTKRPTGRFVVKLFGF
jgi:hypothetical protein